MTARLACIVPVTGQDTSLPGSPSRLDRRHAGTSGRQVAVDPVVSRKRPDVGGSVAQLLEAWKDGDKVALGELVELVEAELRRLARCYMAQERPGHLLEPAALVNELYLRLAEGHAVDIPDRAHFFRFAAQTMRRILVDQARGQQAKKRAAGGRLLSLAEIADPAVWQDRELLALNDALKSLAKIDKRQSRVIELRYFGGLTNDQIGEILGISSRTVKREIHAACLWLRREMRHR